VNQTHNYLILLSMMLAPGLVWAQQAPADEALVQEVTVDGAAESEEPVAAEEEEAEPVADEEEAEPVAAEEEAAEPAADEEPATETADGTETSIGDIEGPPVESIDPVESALVPQAESSATTTAPAAATVSETTPPASDVSEPTESTTVAPSGETEEPAATEPAAPSTNTTDWSYTPRSADPVMVADEIAPAQEATVSPVAPSDLARSADDSDLYPNYVRIHFSGAQQFSTGNELAAVSEGDSMGMGTFGVGVRVARHIAVELNYVSGETSDVVFADTDATFSTAGADARARFDYALFRFFRVYGAVGVGARSASIEVSTSSDTVSQTQLGLAASLVGGVELAWIGRRFGVGAFYEGGYSLQTPYNFDDARFEDGENTGVDLGSIFLHGATHGGGLFVAAYF